MPTTGDGDIELDEYVDSGGTTGDGETYLLFEVEDFDGVDKHSYLRLGGVDPSIIDKYEALAAGTAQTWDDATGEDLASLITSFVDDARDRGTTSERFGLWTKSARRAETAKLHTRGGWRDHTDGNRITTTRGDKIEVIRGNYKMRVLGRSQWSGSAGSGLHYESSGGITYAYDEVPGQIIDVRWDTDDGTWHVFEETIKGHSVDRYHGVMKEWMQGGDVIDRVGSESDYDDEAGWGSGFWGAADDGFVSESDYSRPDNPTHNDGVDWTPGNDLPSVREEIYADEIYEKTICQNMYSKVGSPMRPVPKLCEEVFVTDYVEETYFDKYENYNFGALSIEIWEATFNEKFDGIGTSIKIGLFADVRCGLVTELNTSIGLFGFKGMKIISGFELAAFWKDLHIGIALADLEFGIANVGVDTALLKEKTCKSTWRFGLALFLG